MITRNLDHKSGLVNGVEVILAEIRSCSVTIRLPSGHQAILPRINYVITPDESGLPFTLHRRQYPLISSYALTVHRVQGQSLRRLGIYFSGDVFCHGMLFTAMSRVQSWDDVTVLLDNALLNQSAAVADDCVLKNFVARHIVAHLWS